MHITGIHPCERSRKARSLLPRYRWSRSIEAGNQGGHRVALELPRVIPTDRYRPSKRSAVVWSTWYWEDNDRQGSGSSHIGFVYQDGGIWVRSEVLGWGSSHGEGCVQIGQGERPQCSFHRWDWLHCYQVKYSMKFLDVSMLKQVPTERCSVSSSNYSTRWMGSIRPLMWRSSWQQIDPILLTLLCWDLDVSIERLSSLYLIVVRRDLYFRQSHPEWTWLRMLI